MPHFKERQSPSCGKRRAGAKKVVSLPRLTGKTTLIFYITMAGYGGRRTKRQLGQGHRPEQVHRVSCLHRCLQARAQRPFGCNSDLCEASGCSVLSPTPNDTSRSPAVTNVAIIHPALPHVPPVPCTRRPDGIVDFDREQMYRMQGLHSRLSLRCHLHRPREPYRREV